MPTDKDELTVITGPPLIGVTGKTAYQRVTVTRNDRPPMNKYPTTAQRRMMGVKSLQRDLRRQIMRWDWHFQLRWTGKIQP